MKTDNAQQISEFLNAAYSATDCVVYESQRNEYGSLLLTIWKKSQQRFWKVITSATGTHILASIAESQIRREPPAQLTPLCTSLISKPDRQNHSAGLPVASSCMSGTVTYWFLIEQEHNLDEWEHRQEWIAAAVDSDPAVCDRQRLSRLPGTLNNKPKYRHDPPRSELLRCVKDCRYSWRELQPKCDPPTTPEPKEPMPKKVNNGLLPGDDS